MRITLHHWGVLIASHSLISEQAKFDLRENICRNAAATAFRLGCRITTGTPFTPQNVYRNGVPVRSGTTTPLFEPMTCWSQAWQARCATAPPNSALAALNYELHMKLWNIYRQSTMCGKSSVTVLRILQCKNTVIFNCYFSTKTYRPFNKWCKILSKKFD